MSSATEFVNTVIRHRLAAYLEESELWKREHRLAMACIDFEDHLESGLKLFDRINAVDLNWNRDVFQRKLDYDPEIDAKIRALYQDWLKACAELETVINWLESHFGKVKHADEIRSRCREVHGILTPDEEFFAGDKLVALRDQAIDDFRGGQSIEHVGPR